MKKVLLTGVLMGVCIFPSGRVFAAENNRIKNLEEAVAELQAQLLSLEPSFKGGLSALANQRCPDNNVLVGFDSHGRILCKNNMAQQLRGVDLSRIDFTSSCFAYANMQNANISYSIFGNANLEGTDLSGANMYSSNLYGANLTNANLSGANIELGVFQSARLINTNMTATNLTDADFSYADLTNSDFRNARLNRTFMNWTNLLNANFTGAILDEVVWVNATCPDGTNSDNNNGTCEGHL